MIPISLQPEPRNFDSDVRIPGRKLLERGIPTKSRGFKNHWRHIVRDLHSSYNGVCAYSCMYVMPPGSVDHFFPKTTHPFEAYEWRNYRLSSPKINSHKGDSLSVIDPFTVGDDWFVLDFPSCLVIPGDGLSTPIKEQVISTILVLKLNDDDTLVQERCDIMLMYADGDVSLRYLERRYPFLAKEIVRHGLEDRANDIFRRRAS